ncbi:MAG TPA: sulfur transferase domain-containing protein [Crinalium sp.]|jgi:uncharacterized protein (TIGR01244 family)
MHTLHAIRKINDELAIAGQVTSEQLRQVAQEGYRSVLNLRSPDEAGFPCMEQQEVEALNLNYINIPVKVGAIDRDMLLQALEAIDIAEKPALLHCNSATIAAALALMHIAIRQGAALDQAFKQAEKLGLFGVYSHG